MAIANALKQLFVVTVTIYPFVSEDEAGKPTYGTAASYPAKIERQERITRDNDMQTIRSRRLIYLYTQNTAISTKDRLVLPAGYEPLEPKIMDVRVVQDQFGVHHIVLAT